MIPIVTIVIPIYNSIDCLNSLLENLKLILSQGDVIEILIIDDRSTDGSFEYIADQVFGTKKLPFPEAIDDHLSYGTASNISLYRTVVNSGPGAARNIGIKYARGAYVSFLDCDDLLIPKTYHVLLDYAASFIQKESVHGFSFNYSFIEPSNQATHNLTSLPHEPRRRDMKASTIPAKSRQLKYLGMEMDGSVIFTLFRRSFLIENNFSFRHGLHEDIDFIWRFYCSSMDIIPFDQVVYLKTNRSSSLVHTISEAHIVGYVLAWSSIIESLFITHNVQRLSEEKELRKRLLSGCTGFIAILVMKINQQADIGEKGHLYRFLYDILHEKIFHLVNREGFPVNTRYDIIADKFLKYCDSLQLNVGIGNSIDSFVFGNQK